MCVLSDAHCQAATKASADLRAYFRVTEDQMDEENISVTRTTSASRSPCSSFRSRSRSRSPPSHNDGGVLNLDTKSTKVPPAATTDDDEASTFEKSSPRPVVMESTELRSRLEEAFHNGVAAGEHGVDGSSSYRRSKKYGSTEDIQVRPAHIEPEENGYENGLEAHQHHDLHNRSRKATHKENFADYYSSITAKEKPFSLVPKSLEPINLLKSSLPNLDPVNLPFPLPIPRPTTDITAGLYSRPDFMHYLHLLPYPAFPPFAAYPPHRLYSEEPSSYRKELPKDPRPPSPSSRTSPPKVTPLYHPSSRVDHPSSHQHQPSAAPVASIH